MIYSGLRPGGEKLHEILLSQEEPKRTMPVGGIALAGGIPYFLVQPSHRSWSNKPYDNMPMADPLTEGFVYSSLSAPKLDRETLRKIVQAVPKTQEE